MTGAVRIKSFTAEPGDVATYGPVSDEDGERVFEIEIIGRTKDAVIARLEGVGGRDRAQALRGTRLYVPRAMLPPTGEDEFYHGDLLGLAAELADGAPLGEVTGILTVGETDVLEIDRGGDLPAALVPFTRETAPLVDIAGGRIVLDPPPGLLDAEDDQFGDDAEDGQFGDDAEDDQDGDDGETP